MEYEEIKRLIEIGEPVDGDLSLNNYSVGTISFFPHKLYEALEKLPDDGEVKILADEDEIELYLEKFRNVPPDEFEFEFSKAALIKNDKAYSEFTDEQITEVVIGMFKQADKKVLLRRLLERDVRITFEVMMLNFDYMISSLFLRFLSIAQMRAANEIRKEIDLPPL